MVGRQDAKFELAWLLCEYEEEVLGRVEYDEDLFETEAIADMMQTYLTLLEQMVTDPDSPTW